jgi:uncharacterized heparinase superfamily protein
MQTNSAGVVHAGRLCFLNRQEDVGFPPKWDHTDAGRLWQYNLHYFEWLWALDYADARAVTVDWIEKHLPGNRAVGWEPYPTSLRLMNWCGVFWGKFRGLVEAGPDFQQCLWSSLSQQAQWLMGNLETHLLGNHYLENGAALAYVGSCFHGPTAQRWFERGCTILREQVADQVPADGLHFELSPMYHCRVMYVLAMLSATRNEGLREITTEPLTRMLKALQAVRHPDGRIALLNDSAFGVYNEPAELGSYCDEVLGMASSAAAMTHGCFAMTDAGYYGWRDEKGNYLICDYGQIGPDYIPGHAHADMFSFEMSILGHRVIVDSGVNDYGLSETRRYCRSTGAHNTVDIDGQDQCEMWGAFRVARRGYPQDVRWEPSPDGFALSGWHDGYRRLRGKPVHSRAMEWHRERGLTVHDRITASTSVKATSRLRLHPSCRVRSLRRDCIEIQSPAGTLHATSFEGCPLEIEEGWYFPEFGLRENIKVLTLKARGKEIKLGYRLCLKL